MAMGTYRLVILRLKEATRGTAIVACHKTKYPFRWEVRRLGKYPILPVMVQDRDGVGNYPIFTV